jgi:hypothetical protein
MKLLVIQSDYGPDYLADLFFGELIDSGNHEITSNHLPQYFFDDYPDQHKLYGRGYTVFGKLPSHKKKNVMTLPEEDLLKKLAGKYFDKIIYTSIWRKNIFIQDAMQNYEKNNIIVVDGEDHTNVLNIAPNVMYYKRELINSFDKICLPISFSFPSFHPSKMIDVEAKKYFLAPCVPSVRKSYVFNTEELYYQQYAESYFGLTTKKGGWDCMRHYEIIRAGCIPYFPDIVDKPISTMSTYPVLLQYKANKLFEICMQNPALIENERNSELINLKLEFNTWLKNFGTSHIYQSLI